MWTMALKAVVTLFQKVQAQGYTRNRCCYTNMEAVATELKVVHLDCP